MLYDETAVRANIRNRDGKRVFYLGKGDQLTSGARDYLTRERIGILPGTMAKPDCYRLLNGAVLTQKPEHMTHLRGDILVEKTHPRIAFRGAMDTLEAELLLAQLATQGDTRQKLGQILDLARQILRCEVMEEALGEEKIWGMTPEELRRRSHFPQAYYEQAHFMPAVDDGAPILWINRCRCAARAAELAAAGAFRDGDGNPTRKDLLQAMNRMSSMLYLLMIACKSGRSVEECGRKSWSSNE
jgi:ethanolamine utilization cobalamin adenosyltransferase